MVRGRKEPENLVQVFVRMGVELVARLDEQVVRMMQENPGVRVSRSDVIRILLHRALRTEVGSKEEKKEQC